MTAWHRRPQLGKAMNVLVIGGTGFIGYRLVRRLAAAGHTVTCMDANPAAHSFDDVKERVTVVSGDVGSFEDVMSIMTAARAEYVANLAFLIGSHHPARAAMRVNILGMGNCFEAARLLNVRRVVYAGSFAANGLQANYGDRPVNEDDPVNPLDQYSRCKVTTRPSSVSSSGRRSSRAA